MKKFYELGGKTGLSRAEAGRAFSFGLLGFLAVGLASLAGCLRLQKHETAQPGAKPSTLQNYSGATSAPGAGASGSGGGGAADSDPVPPPKPKTDAGCGPYPGYPCGTRYFTVSRADFFS